MMRSALLLCAAIATALCFACTPPPPPMAGPPPVAGGMAVPSAQTCNAAMFLSKASYLSVPFTPHRGAPLPATSQLPESPNYAGDLAAAFNAAPPGFQQALCGLDAIYINAVSCPIWAACLEGSWGWLRRLPTGADQRIIAISAGFWDGKTTYSSYETNLTQSLLPNSGVTYSGAQSCNPSGVCTSVDDLPTALLAALAHEMGHIRWFEWANSDPAAYCNGNFSGSSWLPPVHRPPPGSTGGYWRNLLTPGERANLRIHNQWLDQHRRPPQINDIDALPPGARQNQLIYQLLWPSAPWASVFAAMSPDEDFVETYKFKVLTSPPNPLTSVVITVPGAGIANVPIDYFNGVKTGLATKVACITNL